MSILEYLIEEISDTDTQRFYRGLKEKINPDLISTKYATNGYSYWTDNVDVAKEYAGPEGYVYYIDIPTSLISDELIDEDPTSETFGDRNLMVHNGKDISINDITGKEYLLYQEHEYFDDNSLHDLIKEL